MSMLRSDSWLSTGRRWPVVALLVGAFTSSLGCASLVTVKGPPAGDQSLAQIDCTAGYTAPIIDTVAGGLSATVAALSAAARASTADPGSRQDLRLPLVSFSVYAAVAAVSATYGYLKVNSCRKAKEQLMVTSGLVPLPARPGSPAAGTTASSPQP
jgi:hypothetical protein